MTDYWKEQTKKPDPEAYEAVRRRWDSIAKPIDGLGAFETIIAKIGAIQNREDPSVRKRSLLLFLSDNGIVEEGVSQSGSEVTHKVAEAMARQRSTVCLMAEPAGVDVCPVDVGMKGEPVPGIELRRVREGSRNFAKEPAMTADETRAAIDAGYQAALRQKEDGAELFLLGEMGIGNTSTATAVGCALLGITPQDAVGRGAGLSGEALKHKNSVIGEALKKYRLDPADVMRILSTFGGYDIAAMVGAIAAARHTQTPVILDGLITLSALYTAERIFPGIKEYCIASHYPKEPMGRLLLKEMQMHAPIEADMALGEGTGAVLLVPLLDVCMNLYENGTRFEGLKMAAYQRI